MSTDTHTNPSAPTTQMPVPLDPKNFTLIDEEALQFLRSETGIQDDAELKEHILRVQKEAYEIYPYPCIWRFAFVTLSIARTFGYDQLLQLGRERENPVFLEIGCCFGSDVRKAVMDGYPAASIVTSDVHAGFWDLGHKLFKSTPMSFPAAFIAGDAFDDAHLSKADPAHTTPPGPTPNLHGLTSLNELRGRVSAIYASSVFHLFDEEQQADLARRLAGLLSPEPGSLIFGSQGGLPVKGYRPSEQSIRGFRMFCHSPESWAELWDGGVFAKGTVRVEAKVVEVDRSEYPNRPPPGTKYWWLLWSVTRI